jgi:hypothetical protein
LLYDCAAMFCFECGQQLPDAARFCLKCGSSVSTAVFPPAVAPATEASQVDAVTKRPYRWGKFHGWCLVTIIPIWALASLFTADTPEEHDRAIWLVIACAVVVPMGIGIIRKRRYGLILVYLTLALSCILILVGFANDGLIGARDAAAGAPLWLIFTIYYHKRRAEFS